MPSSLRHRPVERARPLLGTTVAIRVEGLGEADAHRAIDNAFKEVALIHRLMSFHEPGSDLSRLNRDAGREPVRVHPHTLAVLRHAQAMAEASGGCFDITTAAQLVAVGALPAPDDAPMPDPNGSWRDIELAPSASVVRFHRPLCIDLGGLAKGYAVDRAVIRLRQHGAAGACVNAGGDLRVFGDPTLVKLDTGQTDREQAPVLELQDGSAASSGRLAAARPPDRAQTMHVDGATRLALRGRFVCVVAEDCILADALTKVVMARGEGADPVLRRFSAQAHVIGSDGCWRSLGVAA